MVHFQTSPTHTYHRFLLLLGKCSRLFASISCRTTLSMQNLAKILFYLRYVLHHFSLLVVLNLQSLYILDSYMDLSAPSLRCNPLALTRMCRLNLMLSLRYKTRLCLSFQSIVAFSGFPTQLWTRTFYLTSIPI